MARQARAGAPVALVLLACLGQLCYAAPAFEPAKWNQHDNYSAVSVPYKLLFPPPSEPQGDPGGEDAGPLFPIQPRAGQSELEVRVSQALQGPHTTSRVRMLACLGWLA
jgi:hypothetical protein